MFSKDTYVRRRAELKKLVGEGVIVLFGNNESPANYPANGYTPFRQDSSFLYYFGQHRDGLVGVIDIDNDEEWLIGDDIDVEDIVWMGYTPSVPPRWRSFVQYVAVTQQQTKQAQQTRRAQQTERAQQTKPFTFCRPTATIRRSRSWTCWASTRPNRRRPPR